MSKEKDRDEDWSKHRAKDQSRGKYTPGEAKDTFDVEQILYFSIPGALFVILALVSAQILDITITVDAALFTAALLASIPIGFTAYQAYHSNGLWIRNKLIWRNNPDSGAVEVIKKLIDPGYVGRHDTSEEVLQFNSLAHAVLDAIEETGGSVYSVRVRNVVHSKGACLFVSMVGFLFPFVGIASLAILSFLTSTPVRAVDASLLGAYVLLIGLLAVIFYSGNDSLLRHRSSYLKILVAEHQDDILMIAKDLHRLPIVPTSHDGKL